LRGGAQCARCALDQQGGDETAGVIVADREETDHGPEKTLL